MASGWTEIVQNFTHFKYRPISVPKMHFLGLNQGVKILKNKDYQQNEGPDRL